MEEQTSKLVEVDMSKNHHWLMVVSHVNGYVQVTCVDCNESREHPITSLAVLELYLQTRGDIQLLSRVDVHGN